jgi:2,4-dienoyl-CoA reductase (NADPH2)
VTSNRINIPDVAESVLERGDSDLISMARPFLADPEFVNKAAEGRAEDINTCIGCNQACLDHIFELKIASCLVNPRACHETEFEYNIPTDSPKRIAVVGAGPAGMSFASVAGGRGHQVTLFDSHDDIGGQLHMACRVPGKEEFDETLRFFQGQLAAGNVDLRLGKMVTAAELIEGGFEAVILATGVVPRELDLPGIDLTHVMSYVDVLYHGKETGKQVAIIGAGGIGVDVAVFLSQVGPSTSLEPEAFFKEWGVDRSYSRPGALLAEPPVHQPSEREITIMQRKAGKIGAELGKTTGWIHRATLKQRGIRMLSSARYESIDENAVHVRVGDASHVIPADTVVVCAGQESLRDLHDEIANAGVEVHLIGGADVAAGLDAKRAIDQGARLAAEI